MQKPEFHKCPKCKNVLPFNTEFFNVSNKYKYGLLPFSCKNCKQIYDSNYGSNNRTNLKIEALKHYSKTGIIECECCKENNIDCLSLDHIHNNGAEDRKNIGKNHFYIKIKKLNYPEGLRVLCMNCNTSFYRYGYCPHQNPEKTVNVQEMVNKYVFRN